MIVRDTCIPSTMCISFVHFYPHRFISSSTRANWKCAGNSYVAPEMYSFADAMCRSRCGACDLIQVRTYGRLWATDQCPQCTRELNISVFFEIGGEPLQWPRWIFFIHLYQRLH